MRKLICIILLGCMIVYTGGYQLISSCYRTSIKASMFAYLKQNPNNPFTTKIHLKVKNGAIHHKGFKWEERGKEFYYQGDMYDIVNISYFSDSAIVQCIKDKKETALVQLENEIRQKQDSRSHNSKAGFHKMQMTVFEIPAQNSNVIPFLLIKESIASISHLTIDMDLEVVSPPPDMRLS